MSLYKRNDTWWTDFSVNGQRFRMSLDTSDWREAQRVQKEKISEAQQGKLLPTSQQFSRLSFSEAADRYLEGRRLELSNRSLKKERQLLVSPRQFFGATPLNRISSESLLAYREFRANAGRMPSYLNMEMGSIRRILKRARRWHVVADDIRPLKETRNVGKALSEGEKTALLRIAESRPEWQTARWAAILTLNTTMRGCELKGLRWRDVDLLNTTLTIRRSKTDAGIRVIPLNADALEVILELYKRAREMDALDPNHFVFPACENGKIDPSHSQESWRTAWRSLTRALKCPACGRLQGPGATCSDDRCHADISRITSPLVGLRFHDLRHHAITELAESQASEQTIMAIAGHVSPRMLAHYSHIRLDAKRQALDALSRKPASAQPRRAGYDTRNVTKPLSPRTATPQVIEKNGRPVGTRTPDLYRVKVAL
jgi:integrase